MKAVITLDNGDEILYDNMQLKDIAHALIELAQPKLEVVITDEIKRDFKKQSREKYLNTDGIFIGWTAYESLSVEMKIDFYIRLEHAKQAYNDMVLAYSEKTETLKKEIEILKKEIEELKNK